jgi:hypothetical protein
MHEQMSNAFAPEVGDAIASWVKGHKYIFLLLVASHRLYVHCQIRSYVWLTMCWTQISHASKYINDHVPESDTSVVWLNKVQKRVYCVQNQKYSVKGNKRMHTTWYFLSTSLFLSINNVEFL